MTWVATAIVGAAVVGAVASNRAAGKMEKAANRQLDMEQDQFGRAQTLNEPFRQSGLTAQNRMLMLLGLTPPDDVEGLSVNRADPDFGKYARDFRMSDFEADPGYSFRLAEGLKALQRTAAARGGLLSGSTMKGSMRFGQDLASEEFQNAFNRYQINRSNQLQPLQSLMGAGQSAVNTLTSAGGRFASAGGEAVAAGANARSSGYAGVANSFTSGLGSYLNYRQSQDYMDMLRRGNQQPVTTPISTGYQGGP
jgi:hypothetical protein